jgi:hypothetical protein
MFGNYKKDPLVDAVAKVMKENETRRQVERSFNEEIGVFSRNAVPNEKKAEYDRVLAERTAVALNEELKGNQHKIDANKNNKIDGQDFKILKAKKGQMEEENEAAEKKMEKGEESKEAESMEEETLDERNEENKGKKNAAVAAIGAKNKDEKHLGSRGMKSSVADKIRGREMTSGKDRLEEKAPPGDKYERMVKHIKSKYSKGGLSDKEKSIAYATAWKAKGKESK